jgi:hypothetical protein
MNEQATRKSPNLKPLLLIPLAVVIAKGASRRRARWEAAGYGSGDRRHGYGRHGFGGRFAMDEDGELHLPPKIESMLETWHTHAHEKVDQPGTTTV